MAEAMTPVRKDSPLWLAWLAYIASPEYANAKRWALQAEHTEGSLWAAFEAGFNAERRDALGTPTKFCTCDVLWGEFHESGCPQRRDQPIARTQPAVDDDVQALLKTAEILEAEADARAGQSPVAALLRRVAERLENERQTVKVMERSCLQAASELLDLRTRNTSLHAQAVTAHQAWTEASTACDRLTAEVTALRAQLAVAEAANERDRTGYSNAVRSLREWCRRWSLMATSRGSYAWDDDEYQREFGRAIDEMHKIADRMEKKTHAYDYEHCPTTQAAVDAARRESAAGEVG